MKLVESGKQNRAGRMPENILVGEDTGIKNRGKVSSIKNETTISELHRQISGTCSGSIRIPNVVLYEPTIGTGRCRDFLDNNLLERKIALKKYVRLNRDMLTNYMGGCHS